MPSVRHRFPTQFNLFHPTPKRPTWQNLPPEVQTRVLELLSQLLRDPSVPPCRREQIAATDQRKEARDE